MMVNTQGFNPQTGEWNDSLTGDFIWGNANIGEALSCVVTPFTWSVIGLAYDHMNVLPGYHIAGNIAGRPYQNGTVMVSALQAIGKNVDAMFQELGGRESPPEGVTIPLIPVSWQDKVFILINGVRLQLRERAALRSLSAFLAENPSWCASMRRRAAESRTRTGLADLWPEIEVNGARAFWSVVGSAWHYAEIVAPLRRELTDMVGEAGASAMLSGVSTRGQLLASLGPVVGLSKVRRGELSRQEYLRLYGHRGPGEVEFAAPRPAEDPTWLDRQLDLMAGSDADADEMLVRQRAASEVAWTQFRQRYPDRSAAMQGRLAEAAQASRAREAVRSELTRQVWAGRTWALRAGQLTGLGDDIFYLIAAEVLDLLADKPAPVETIPTRKKTDARYRALPPYPPIISGQFHPLAWFADPNRRHDLFDSHLPELPPPKDPAAHVIRGVPGSAGRAEGQVRRLDSPDQGQQFKAGEILVTSQTNVGWTPIFPLAAAIVTDVGAPLSHAAIVARELGIPAVVGCGDATTRLCTGDRVQVDGAKGSVKLMEASPQ